MATRDLAGERYVNLETFRKDGSGVKTPVWAAGLDGKLVVLTDGTSFKVKRIRANPKIRVAPCDARGNVRGAWVDGEARILEDPAHAARAHEALKKKYGWQVWLLDVGSKIAGRYRRRAFLELAV
jgi:PPOX class probable F420-dependent enzyme